MELELLQVHRFTAFRHKRRWKVDEVSAFARMATP
jgi:hypothetical protein